MTDPANPALAAGPVPVPLGAPGHGSLLMRMLQSLPRRSWIGIGIFAPSCSSRCRSLHLAVPAGHPLHLSDYFITVVGKIICYAIVAVAIDLIWGYAGILSLGHGVFFALGGYAFGMYLMRQIGRDGIYQADLPDFMVFLDWKELPWYWHGSDSLPLGAACMVLVVPALLAFVFGFFAFRSRIKGVYFSIITQALTYAFMLLFFRNETGFGGNNGFTDFKRILGYAHHHAVDAGRAVRPFGGGAASPRCCSCRYLVTSKFGRVLTAIRDAESRVMFLGYNPLWYKLFVWTLSARALRDRRRALRAAGRHHQSERDDRRPTRSRSPSGWRSADAAR